MSSTDVRHSRVVREGKGDVRVLLGVTPAPPVYTDADLAAAYERGVVAARAAAAHEREAAVVALARSVHEIGQNLGAEQAAMRSVYADRLVTDVFTVARWLLRHELATDPNLMRDRLEAALRDLDATGTVVSVAPQMVELVTGWVPGVSVRADDDLDVGELRVASAKTTVDGTIDDALERLREALGLPEASVPC